VLENHHISAALSLLALRDDTNLLVRARPPTHGRPTLCFTAVAHVRGQRCFEEPARTAVRTTIVKLVLATDLGALPARAARAPPVCWLF
jgi:hypothetical protein